MTEQERASAAQAEIEAVCARYGCGLVGSWEPVSDNTQIRSRQITITALPNWTPPAPAEPAETPVKQPTNGKVKA